MHSVMMLVRNITLYSLSKMYWMRLKQAAIDEFSQYKNIWLQHLLTQTSHDEKRACYKTYALQSIR